MPKKTKFLIKMFLFALVHPIKAAKIYKAMRVMNAYEPDKIALKMGKYLSHINPKMVPKYDPESPKQLSAILEEDHPYGKDFRS